MTDDGVITSQMLLKHIQSQKYELLQHMKEGFANIDRQFKSVDERFQRLEMRMKEGFEEARQDRENIHEDLEATIKMQFKHEKQLAVLTGSPLPEEY